MQAARAHRLAGAAEAHPERAHPADEGRGLRRRLRLRPRHRGRLLRPGLLSAEAWSAPRFYEPTDRGDERGLRERLLSFAARRARLSRAGRRVTRANAPATPAEGDGAIDRNRQDDRIAISCGWSTSSIGGAGAVAGRSRGHRRAGRRRNNAALGLTGLLVHQRQRFYGVLEGPRRQRLRAHGGDHHRPAARAAAHPARGADRAAAGSTTGASPSCPAAADRTGRQPVAAVDFIREPGPRRLR